MFEPSAKASLTNSSREDITEHSAKGMAQSPKSRHHAKCARYVSEHVLAISPVHTQGGKVGNWGMASSPDAHTPHHSSGGLGRQVGDFLLIGFVHARGHAVLGEGLGEHAADLGRL